MNQSIFSPRSSTFVQELFLLQRIIHTDVSVTSLYVLEQTISAWASNNGWFAHESKRTHRVRWVVMLSRWLCPIGWRWRSTPSSSDWQKSKVACFDHSFIYFLETRKSSHSSDGETTRSGSNPPTSTPRVKRRYHKPLKFVCRNIPQSNPFLGKMYR